MKFKLNYPVRKIKNPDTGKLETYYEKETSGIFLYHHANNKRYKYGIGVKVKVKNWSDKNQKATDANNYWMDADSINAKLRNVKQAFNQYEKECIHNGDPLDLDELIYAVDVALDSSKSEEAQKINKQLSLVELMAQFLSNPTYKLTAGTINAKTSTLKAIFDYNEKYKKNPIDFDSIDLDMKSRFIKFHKTEQSTKHKSTGKIKIIPPKKQNTLWRYIKELKWILKYAEEEEGYKVNQAYKRKKFNEQKEEIDNAYLTLEEINQMFNVDRKRLRNSEENSLNIFVVGCNTGLRLSDIKRLKPENIVKEEGRLFIDIVMLKTGSRVMIPVKKQIVPIIKNLPFKSIADQTVNKAIKKIIKIVDIDKGLPITSHTARRSYCTNAHKSGMNSLDIMAISGHKTEKEFMKYINVTTWERAQKIGNHPFMQ